MNKLGKIALLAFVLLYVVSPIDLCPGPIDDILMILLALAAKKRAGITVVDEDNRIIE